MAHTPLIQHWFLQQHLPFMSTLQSFVSPQLNLPVLLNTAQQTQQNVAQTLLVAAAIDFSNQLQQLPSSAKQQRLTLQSQLAKALYLWGSNQSFINAQTPLLANNAQRTGPNRVTSSAPRLDVQALEAAQVEADTRGLTHLAGQLAAVLKRQTRASSVAKAPPLADNEPPAAASSKHLANIQAQLPGHHTAKARLIQQITSLTQLGFTFVPSPAGENEYPSMNNKIISMNPPQGLNPLWLSQFFTDIIIKPTTPLIYGFNEKNGENSDRLMKKMLRDLSDLLNQYDPKIIREIKLIYEKSRFSFTFHKSPFIEKEGMRLDLDRKIIWIADPFIFLPDTIIPFLKNIFNRTFELGPIEALSSIFPSDFWLKLTPAEIDVAYIWISNKNLYGKNTTHFIEEIQPNLGNWRIQNIPKYKEIVEDHRVWADTLYLIARKLGFQNIGFLRAELENIYNKKAKASIPQINNSNSLEYLKAQAPHINWDLLIKENPRILQAVHTWVKNKYQNVSLESSLSIAAKTLGLLSVANLAAEIQNPQPAGPPIPGAMWSLQGVYSQTLQPLLATLNGHQTAAVWSVLQVLNAVQTEPDISSFFTAFSSNYKLAFLLNQSAQHAALHQGVVLPQFKQGLPADTLSVARFLAQIKSRLSLALQRRIDVILAPLTRLD
jgi:hypothetical protein